MSKKTGEKILEILRRPFLPEQIKTRQGGWNPAKKAHEEYKYVPSDLIVKRLREAFGLSLTVRVPNAQRPISDFIGKDSSGSPTVIVFVEIEYTDPDTGFRETVPGVGSKKITNDLGNDFKAAVSKAISNAAKKLEVAVDLDGEDHEEDEAAAQSSSGGIAPSGGGIKPVSAAQPAEQTTASSGVAEVATAAEEEKPKTTTTQTTQGIKPGGIAPGSSAVAAKQEKAATGGIVAGGKAVAPDTSQKTPAPAQGNSGSSHKCEESGCGNEIVPAMKSDGTMMSVEDIIGIGANFFGKKMCNVCLGVAKKKLMEQQAS